MDALIDGFVDALKPNLGELDAATHGWPVHRYQRPLSHVGLKAPAVAVYPMNEDANAISSDYDFLVVRLGLEYWEQAGREAETLMRDQPAAKTWLRLHGRFKAAVYAVSQLPALDVHEIRYAGTDFSFDREASVRIFRLQIRLWRKSPTFG